MQISNPRYEGLLGFVLVGMGGRDCTTSRDQFSLATEFTELLSLEIFAQVFAILAIWTYDWCCTSAPIHASFSASIPGGIFPPTKGIHFHTREGFGMAYNFVIAFFAILLSFSRRFCWFFFLFHFYSWQFTEEKSQKLNKFIGKPYIPLFEFLKQ